MDRFHLVLDVIKRLPPTEKGAKLDLVLQKKLGEHKRYIEKYGKDMPEILEWKWGK